MSNLLQFYTFTSRKAHVTNTKIHVILRKAGEKVRQLFSSAHFTDEETDGEVMSPRESIQAGGGAMGLQGRSVMLACR